MILWWLKKGQLIDQEDTKFLNVGIPSNRNLKYIKTKVGNKEIGQQPYLEILVLLYHYVIE